MIKYIVKSFNVECGENDDKLQAYFNKTNYSYKILKAFDNYSDAEKFFDEQKIDKKIKIHNNLYDFNLIAIDKEIYNSYNDIVECFNFRKIKGE